MDTAKEEKDLGIIITKDLKVSQQCKQAYAKASRMLGLINRSIKHKDRDILLSLYKSLVRFHLEYCIPAWSPHYVKGKELIEQMQHRFTRMFPKLRTLPYLRRLQHLKLWTIEEQRVCADLIEVYRIIHGISSVSFDIFFEYNNYGATRGHLLKLTKRRASTELRHHFFSERVINIWNSLDNRTVTSGSINFFKGNLEILKTVKRDKPVCWQLMVLGQLRLNRPVREALSGKLLMSFYCRQTLTRQWLQQKRRSDVALLIGR